MYTALERGYFRDGGVDPEITKFVSGADVVLQLAGNQLDIGSGGPDPSFFNAVARGVSLKLIASESMVTKNDASAALVVRQDLIDSGKYKAPADLKGMTIAVVSLGTSSQMYVERILDKAGLKIEDVKLTTVPFPNMVTALANKAVDAAWSVEPFVTVEKARSIASIAVPLSEAYPGAITQMLTIGSGFAKDHPDVAKSFVTAYLKGERDYYKAFVSGEDPAGRNAIIQFLPKYTGGTAEQLASIGMTGADPNAQIDAQYIDTVQSYFASKGTVTQKVDVKQAIDSSYIDAALQQLGKASVSS
jgi:NitT/TauT family transport system substrate-binding protein